VALLGKCVAAESALWQVNPRSGGAGHPAPAAQNLGVVLLVTALAHLHVRNLAPIFAAKNNIFPMAVPY
jgi:hypothetical protein